MITLGNLLWHKWWVIHTTNSKNTIFKTQIGKIKKLQHRITHHDTYQKLI